MSEAHVVLNDDFIPVYYNGGTMFGGTGIFNIINHSLNSDTHFSYDGANFDLILKYTRDEPFTLSHLTFHPCPESHAVLRTAAVWVHPEVEGASEDALPDISYSSNFDNIVPEEYLNKERNLREKPYPDAIFTLAKKRDTPVALATPKAGKFIHIKFISSTPPATNIDIGKIFLVGKRGVHGEVATIDSTEEKLPITGFAGLASFQFDKPKPVISSVSEEDKKMLLSLNALRHIPKFNVVNKMHTDFEEVINICDIVLFIADEVIEVAQAAVANGSATEKQKNLVEGYTNFEKAVKSLGNKNMYFFSVDPSVEHTTVSPLLAYISLPHAHITGPNFNIILPPASEIDDKPYIIVSVVAEGEKYFYYEQDTEKLQAYLSKTKKRSLTESLKNLNINEECDNVTIITEAILQSLKSKDVPLVPHVANQALTHTVHPNYPHIKIANLKSFNELVIDNEKPVIAFFSGGDSGEAFAPSMAVLSNLYARHNVNVDFVSIDQTLNNLPKDLYPDTDNGVVRLYLKSNAPKPKGAKHMKPNQVNVILKNASGARVVMFDLPLDSKSENEAEEEEEEDEEDEEEEEDTKITVPSLITISTFFGTSGLEIPTTSEFEHDLQKMNNALTVSDYILGISSICLTDLSSVGVGPNLMYRLEEGNKIDLAVKDIIACRNEVLQLEEHIPAPVGTWTTDSNKEKKSFEDAADELLNILKKFPAATEVVANYTPKIKNARALAYKAGRFLTAFSDVVSKNEEKKNALSKAYAALSHLVGEFVPCSSNLPPIYLKITEDDKAVVVNLEELETAITNIRTAINDVEPEVLDVIAEKDKACNFHKYVVTLNTPDHLQRLLFGYKYPLGPKSITTKRTKKDNDPLVHNASERLVVLFFTADWDISYEYRSDIAEAAQIAQETTDDDPDVVYARIPIETEFYESIKQFFHITELPTMCVFQGGDELPTLRMEGVTKDNHDNFLKMLSQSETNQWDNFEDLEDEDLLYDEDQFMFGDEDDGDYFADETLDE